MNNSSQNWFACVQLCEPADFDCQRACSQFASGSDPTPSWQSAQGDFDARALAAEVFATAQVFPAARLEATLSGEPATPWYEEWWAIAFLFVGLPLVVLILLAAATCWYCRRAGRRRRAEEAAQRLPEVVITGQPVVNIEAHKVQRMASGSDSSGRSSGRSSHGRSSHGRSSHGRSSGRSSGPLKRGSIIMPTVHEGRQSTHFERPQMRTGETHQTLATLSATVNDSELTCFSPVYVGKIQQPKSHAFRPSHSIELQSVSSGSYHPSGSDWIPEVSSVADATPSTIVTQQRMEEPRYSQPESQAGSDFKLKLMRAFLQEQKTLVTLQRSSTDNLVEAV